LPAIFRPWFSNCVFSLRFLAPATLAGSSPGRFSSSLPDSLSPAANLALALTLRMEREPRDFPKRNNQYFQVVFSATLYAAMQRFFAARNFLQNTS
jgi:hypothetical protein